MKIKIIKQTSDWIAIDKPAGIVIHDVPGEKHAGKTIADWYADNFPTIKKESWPDQSRAGIVHRLDAETSGVLLIAKNPSTLKNLQKQFKNREIKKTYVALVVGNIPKHGEFSGYITRKPKSTVHELKLLNLPWSKGKESFTEYEKINTYDFISNPISLLQLYPKTGRTHQLRVQLFHAGSPILGDKIYNTKHSQDLTKKLKINRHLLHAKKIFFVDPKTNELVKIETDIPNDFRNVLNKLNHNQEA